MLAAMNRKQFSGIALCNKFHATIALTGLKTVMCCFEWKIPGWTAQAKQIQEEKIPL
jgi:hypothetical protein